VNQLLVVESTKRWPLHIPGVEVVPARTYLTDARFAERRGVAVYNLCRTYGYQTLGYYVSLLAAARADGRGRAIDWKRVEALRPYGGIRIEDNVVAQAGAPRNLTREAFAAAA